MSAEMDAFLEEVRALNAKIDALYRFVTAAKAVSKPGYTIQDAAKLLHCSRWTIQRKLATGELRKVRGRIPQSLLDPYLS